jgi:hypothetical protein
MRAEAVSGLGTFAHPVGFAAHELYDEGVYFAGACCAEFSVGIAFAELFARHHLGDDIAGIKTLQHAAER